MGGIGALLAPVLSMIGQGASKAMEVQSNREANEMNYVLAQEQMAWNEQMWNKQNEYNSPAAQMQRLKEAELNPRLVYGQSSGAAAGNAGDVKGYDRAEARSVFEGGQAFQNMVSDIHRAAQTDNVKAQTDVVQQQAINAAQDSLLKDMELKDKTLKYKLDSELFENNVDAAQERLKELRSKARSSEVQAQVDEAAKNPRIQEAVQKAMMASQKTRGAALDNQLKQIENNMKKDGIYPSDPVWLRVLFQSGLVTKETIKRLDPKQLLMDYAKMQYGF